MVTQDGRNRLMAFTERITGLGLKLGVPLLVLAAGFLLITLFGEHIRQLPKMKPADKAYLLNGVQTASMLLKYSSIAVVCSLILRFFFEERLGQLMSLFGAAFYFGIPALLVRTNPGAASNGLVKRIVGELLYVGLMFLIPGVWLVLRDSVVRIWRGLSDKRVVEHRRNTATGLDKGKKNADKLICKCWEMSYCRDFIRDICPAFKKKKSCWRIKSGCMCDEGIILRSMAKNAPDNDSYRGIMKSLGLNSPTSSSVPGSVKRARCRRCSIYAEHQRQKYRILCPLVIPLVIGVFYYYYGMLAYWVSLGLSKADRFFSFLVSRANQGNAHDIQIMTAITVIWLGIIAVCYCLRALEYLIFDLQV